MMGILKMLPITNKTVLKDSKILSVIERWSTQTIEASVAPAITPATSTVSSKDSGNEGENKTSGGSIPASSGDTPGKAAGM